MQPRSKSVKPVKKLSPVNLENCKAGLAHYIQGNHDKTQHLGMGEIYPWYKQHAESVNEQDKMFLPMLIEVMTIHAKHYKEKSKKKKNAQQKADLKNKSSNMAKMAWKLISKIPRESLFLLEWPGRPHLHRAYLNLIDTKLLTANELGACCFGALRTMPEVSPFDHFLLIKKYKDDLPANGICNAITTEAIRFFAKTRVEEKKFFEKLRAKLEADEKPVSFLSRMNKLQQHNVSAVDDVRVSGLPKFDTCFKAMQGDSIEIVASLDNNAIKHSLLVKVDYHHRHPARIRLIDATFGEAVFPYTKTGKENFDHAMKILETGYKNYYGKDLGYVLVTKQENLLRSPALLFKSSADKDEPDLTFKDKIQGYKKPGSTS